MLIIAASALIITGAGGGTFLLLKQFAPFKTTDPAATSEDITSSLKKAQDLFAKGDFAGAKAEYQSILDTYKAQNNESGVADMEMQLRVVEATAKAPQAPRNTDKGKVTVGSQPE